MIIANEKTLVVIREFGRKTNPRHTEKLKVLSFVAVDGKYVKYTERIKVGDIIMNIDKNLPQGFLQLVANLNESRKDIDYNGQKIKLDILEDNLKFLNVEVIRNRVDGALKKKYKFNDSDIPTSEFLARVVALEKCGENVSFEDLNGKPLVDYVISGKNFEEIDKKSAQWLKTIFYRGDFVIVRRTLTFEIGGKNSSDTYWYIIGEDNSLAREEKFVSDEFQILPFMTGTEVTEIIPR